MNKLTLCWDARLFWGVRFLFYKLFAGKLRGLGYLGAPSFIKGFDKFNSDAGLGIFPGWRIEILAGNVNFGKNIRIGNNFLLNCGGLIEIGDDVTISSNVFIGTSDVEISNDLNRSFKEWKIVEKPIIIERGSFIGFGSVILPGTTLGQGCVVGANSVVRGTFEAGSVIAGIPARVIRTRH